jgi:hypothetical protein
MAVRERETGAGCKMQRDTSASGWMLGRDWSLEIQVQRKRLLRRQYVIDSERPVQAAGCERLEPRKSQIVKMKNLSNPCSAMNTLAPLQCKELTRQQITVNCKN